MRRGAKRSTMSSSLLNPPRTAAPFISSTIAIPIPSSPQLIPSSIASAIAPFPTLFFPPPSSVLYERSAREPSFNVNSNVNQLQRNCCSHLPDRSTSNPLPSLVPNTHVFPLTLFVSSTSSFARVLLADLLGVSPRRTAKSTNSQFSSSFFASVNHASK